MASTHTDGPAMGTFVPDTVVYESDVEDDQEVDQLDSDTEPEENADAAQQPAAKNGAAPKVVKPRNPGHSLVSLTRIENMVQSEGAYFTFDPLPLTHRPCSGVTGSLALSKEGLFVVAMATVRVSFVIVARVSCRPQGVVHQAPRPSRPAGSKCSPQNNGWL